MSEREPLPSKREHRVLALTALDHKFQVGFGCYPDGRVGEVFVQAVKTGTMIEDAAKDAAILASLALQFGAPLDLLRDALTRDRGRKPMSVITCVLDAIAADLAAMAREGEARDDGDHT